MLSTAKTYTFSSKFDCFCNIFRSISVCSYNKAFDTVSPFEEFLKIAVHLRINSCNRTFHNFACSAVHRDYVILMEYPSISSCKCFVFQINLQVFTTSNAWFAHTFCNNCSMRSHTASKSQNTLRCNHTMDVIRTCFNSDKNNFLSVVTSFCGFFGIENNLSDSSAGRCGKTFCNLR